MAIKVGEKDLFPYLGDYGPVSIYKGEQKLAGYKWAEKSGQELHFDNTYNSHVQVEVDGQSYQHAGSGKNLINLRALDSLFVYAGGRVKTTDLSPVYTISGDVVTVSDQSLNYELLGYKYIVKDSIKNIYIKFSSTAGASSMLYYMCYDSTGVTTTSQLGREMAKNENIYSTMIQSSVIPQNTSYILIGIGFSLISDYALDSIIISHEDTQYEPPAPTPDSPIEIESVNDFDVVSAAGGRNLVLNSNNIIMNGSDNGNNRLAVKKSDYISITPKNNGNVYNTRIEPSMELVKGHEYTLSFDVLTNTAIGVYWSAYTGGGSYGGGSISDTKGEWIKHEFTYTQRRGSFNARFLFGFDNLIAGNEVKYRNLKLEKGTTATPYTPAPEDIAEDSGHPLIDKINLSLSEPLRSVGDVKDRLFRDSGGLWKVERNVGETILDGNWNWIRREASTTEIDYYETWLGLPPMVDARKIESTHFSGTLTQNHYPVNHIRMSRSGWIRFSIKHGTFNKISELKDWLDNNHIIVNYEANPEIEILDQELQDQLNTLKSFKGSNYVYTVQKTDNPHKEQLKPTLHAKTEVKDI